MSEARAPAPDDRVAYIAFVGNRPAAIAVALLTLGRRLHAVRLIVTPRVRDVFRRLDVVRRELPPAVEVSEQPCDDVLRAFERLQPWAAALPRGVRPAFHVDPGLGFGAARLTRDLPDVVLLSATESHLIERSRGGDSLTGLVNLGLPMLLELYGVSGTHRELTAEDWGPRKAVADLELALAAKPLSFVRALERCGRLYGLCKIVGSDGPERVRTLEALCGAAELHDLQPVMAIASDDDTTLAEARSAGWIGTRLEAREQWPDFPALPSGAVPSWRPADRPVPAGEGTGPPLMVWLGPDPSPTLTALFTHRPKHALILVSKNDPRVIEVASRLEQFARVNTGVIPVGELQLFLSDSRGSLPADLLQTLDRNAVRFNVTPGTRLEVCSTVVQTNLPLWSLHQQEERSECLTATDDHLPLKAVQLQCHAQIATGVRHSGEDPRSWNDERSRILIELGGRLAQELTRRRLRLGNLGNPRDDRGHPTAIPGLRVQSDGSVRIEKDGQVLSGSIRMTTSGQWLEDLIAVCVLATASKAGKDAEVRVNVKWAHSLNAFPDGIVRKGDRIIGSPGRARAETDVIARIGRDLFLFDAKAGENPDFGEHRAEAAARAVMLGRFCVPVAVRPWIDPSLARAFRAPSRGVAALDLSALVDADTLMRRLRRMVAARRRAAEDEDH